MLIGGDISPKEKDPPWVFFFDYFPRVISNTSRALQMEKDRTIFIKMKVNRGQIISLHPPPRVESDPSIDKIKKNLKINSPAKVGISPR